MRRSSAGHVAPGPVDRHEHLAHPDACALVFDRPSGLHLVPRLDLGVGELQRREQVGVEPGRGRVERGGRHGQIGQPRAVEALGTGTERLVAARANLGDDRGHRRADVVARAGWSRQRGAHVGGTAEIDSSQHGERLIVLGTLRSAVRIGTA